MDDGAFSEFMEDLTTKLAKPRAFTPKQMLLLRGLLYGAADDLDRTLRIKEFKRGD